MLSGFAAFEVVLVVKAVEKGGFLVLPGPFSHLMEAPSAHWDLVDPRWQTIASHSLEEQHVWFHIIPGIRKPAKIYVGLGVFLSKRNVPPWVWTFGP